MTSERTTFDPAQLRGVDRYKLLTGLVVPRPIGWVGTRAPDGTPNLAPYSYFNCVAATPPTVVLGLGAWKRGSPKDTYANIAATGEFTLSLVSEDLGPAMVRTAGEFPPGVDEFALAGLTPADAEVVRAPYVGEARWAMECRHVHTVPLGEPGAETAWVVLGEVVRIHVDTDLLEGTRVDQAGLRALGRFAGTMYCTTADGLLDLGPAPAASRTEDPHRPAGGAQDPSRS